MGLRLGGSDRVAAFAPKGANEFQGKGRVTSAQLWRLGNILARIFSQFLRTPWVTIAVIALPRDRIGYF